ncbi:hypothetical protein SBRY_30095 [Actinacidiphila bryophytorum]|uniref:Uncharacterized protein n=1 Tax=Actinacidiphila bryophytorum TaxID=1436133 RepID=A0A9W4MG27_9ACTN|nr:hypothetical protein SBRY_30095 [Actinacidiphila bryophytorum]
MGRPAARPCVARRPPARRLPGGSRGVGRVRRAHLPRRLGTRPAGRAQRRHGGSPGGPAHGAYLRRPRPGTGDRGQPARRGARLGGAAGRRRRGPGLRHRPRGGLVRRPRHRPGAGDPDRRRPHRTPHPRRGLGGTGGGRRTLSDRRGTACPLPRYDPEADVP